MEYRHLTQQEIDRLTIQGCSCKDWQRVMVKDGFQTDNVRDVHFSGNVRLGRYDKEITFLGGISQHTGIFHATLHNVTVGDNCYIKNVQNYIANYNIADHVVIENVDIMVVTDRTTFGNGVAVSVLDETGGRKILIHNKLSAQLAYISVLYRHYPELISCIDELTMRYVEKHASEIGVISENVTIVNTGSIKNVNIGAYTKIHGACRLENGSINSNHEAVVEIGYNVVCEDFIISSGSSITDGAMLTRCFVGQACQLGHTYSASDSLFFSNCQGENGEACAIFAGPYTVTHHKSTLLISGVFSFMNAGSGSNQSNHMYKLGPIHQGTLERGAKTSSDSYILWPSKVGAFSLVMGRHITHSDTSDFPFSYLIEEKNATYMTPGVNLRSVGTMRDNAKWPRRDRRTDSHRLDQINYNLLSPYTIQKMIHGRQKLMELRRISGELSDIYSFQSTKIRNHSLKRGIELYEIAICKFLGNSIIKRLEKTPFQSNDEICRRLLPDIEIGTGEWVDISGMIAPKTEVDRLVEDVVFHRVATLKEINARFEQIHRNYYTYEWTWAYGQIQEFFHVDLTDITARQIIQIVEKWRNAVIQLDHMIYDDAKKEYSLAYMTGFGADGTRQDKEEDFEQVRGQFETNPLVLSVLQHIEAKNALAEEIIARLSPLA